MEFLKNFDLELFNLYLAISEDMGANPMYAVSRAQLFVKKLHDKLPGEQTETFIHKFEEELSWLIGCHGEITVDEALVAHEMLYRMASWAALKAEAKALEIPAYNPPLSVSQKAVTEAEVMKIIEQKVLVTLCGIIKEMDTILSALDDIEQRLLKNTEQDQRLVQVELEIQRLKQTTNGFTGLLKSKPRTPGK